MIKFIEFLGRLVVRGYVRSAAVERKVASVEAKAAEKLALKSREALEASKSATAKAATLEAKGEQLKAFFK